MSLQLSLDNTTLLEAWVGIIRAALGKVKAVADSVYRKIVEWAHRYARLHGRCFMQAYLEALRSPAIARQPGLRRADDEPFLVNNNL